MLHRRRFILSSLLVLILLAVSVPAALAQSGGGDKFVVGGNYTLNSGETLNGNLFVAGGNVELRSGSTVNGDVSVAGGSIRVAGHIRGNVNVIGGSVSLTNTSEIDGNVDSIGGSIDRAAGAVIHGSVQQGGQALGPRSFVAPELPSVVAPDNGFSNNGPLSGLLRLLGRFFGAIGMGLLLAVIAIVVLLIAPRSTAQVATTVATQPALNFATGLLTLVLALLVGIPLLIACGLGLLVWLVAFIALLYGWFAVGLWVGQRLLNLVKVRTSSSVPEMALGVFLITWLAWVAPLCIGWLFGLVAGSIGMGAVLLTRFGTQPSGGLSGAGGGRPAGSGSGGTPVAPGFQQHPGAPSQRQPGSAPASDTPGTATSSEASGEAAPTKTNDVPTYTPSADLGTAGSSGPRAAEETTLSTDAPDPGIVSREGRPNVSLEDLSTVQGITPEIAARLRVAGSSTLVALAVSDPETLARQAGVNADLVREQDWVGQARRLLG